MPMIQLNASHSMLTVCALQMFLLYCCYCIVVVRPSRVWSSSVVVILRRRRVVSCLKKTESYILHFITCIEAQTA